MNALQQHDYEQLSTVERLIGVDEAGRGCLAGPVMAGACILGQDFFASAEALKLSAAINDSKQLSEPARGKLFAIIQDLCGQGLLDFEVAAGSLEEIETLNILGATRLAMQRALESLAIRARGWELPAAGSDEPLFQQTEKLRILVDGRPLKPFPYAHTGLVKGDGKSLAIAVASIAAKVTRDRVMTEFSKEYPAYFFERHKGYGTALHRDAICTHGPLPIHRKLFLRKLLDVKPVS